MNGAPASSLPAFGDSCYDIVMLTTAVRAGADAGLDLADRWERHVG